MAVEILATSGFSLNTPGGNWKSAGPTHQIDKSDGSFFAFSVEMVTQKKDLSKGEVLVDLLDSSGNIVAMARLSLESITDNTIFPLISLFPSSSESISEQILGGALTRIQGQQIRGFVVPGATKWQNASIRCMVNGVFVNTLMSRGFRMYVHTEMITSRPPPSSIAPLSLFFRGNGVAIWTQTFSFKT